MKNLKLSYNEMDLLLTLVRHEQNYNETLEENERVKEFEKMLDLLETKLVNGLNS